MHLTATIAPVQCLDSWAIGARHRIRGTLDRLAMGACAIGADLNAESGVLTFDAIAAQTAWKRLSGLIQGIQRVDLQLGLGVNQ